MPSIFTRSNGEFVADTESVVEDTPLFTIRPSLKRPDSAAVVVLNHPYGESLRTVLVRYDDVADTVKVRLLDGNPRERSSSSETQAVAVLNVAELSHA